MQQSGPGGYSTVQRRCRCSERQEDSADCEQSRANRGEEEQVDKQAGV